MTINAFLSRVTILKYMIIYLLVCGGRMFWTFSGAIKSLSSWPIRYTNCTASVNIHQKNVFIRQHACESCACYIIYLCKRPRSCEIEYCDSHISRSQKVPGRRAAGLVSKAAAAKEGGKKKLLLGFINRTPEKTAAACDRGLGRLRGARRWWREERRRRYE